MLANSDPKMDLESREEINVSPLKPGEEHLWAEFLNRSTNATLFHDLAFLAYHPAGKFQFHHLVFRKRKIVAVLPGGLLIGEAGTSFHSPLGASFGGFALPPRTSAEAQLHLVNALKGYARREGWAGIEITLPPPNFDRQNGASTSFALFSGGFSITSRWLCHGIDIADEAQYEDTFLGRQITAVRAAAREGLSTIEVGLDGLDLFLPVFRDTYARHGAVATHSEDELRDLMKRFPERIRLFIATLDGVPVAGIVVFRLTQEVATTFYICTGAEHSHRNGAAFVIANAMGRLAALGVRHLDFGPSASDENFNRGVAFFKEGLGAAGSCRDRWRLDLGAR